MTSLINIEEAVNVFVSAAHYVNSSELSLFRKCIVCISGLFYSYCFYSGDQQDDHPSLGQIMQNKSDHMHNNPLFCSSSVIFWFEHLERALS